MFFDEIQLPPTVSWGVTGGPRFSTTVLVSSEGYESRNRHWAHPRREWDATQTVRDQTELDELLAFFYARGGAARGFRFKDWIDYKHDMGEIPTPASLYPAIATGTTGTFQLAKTYADAGGGHWRVITKPVVGTIQILANGVPLTTPGNYTLDPTTGVVTVTSGIANGNAMTWTGEFDVPARFSGDNMPVSIDHYQTYSWGQIKVVEIRDPAIYVPQIASAGPFHDVRMPDQIAFGVTGGPGFSTQVFASTGGHEARVGGWAAARATYAAAYDLQDLDEFEVLLRFFHARSGRAFGFRFRDWSDYRHNAVDPALRMAFATTTAGDVTYPLTKTYISGAVSWIRAITKPVLGTVSVYKDGVLLTEGAGVGATLYTLSYLTGVVTLGADPGAGALLEWTGEFDVSARFDSDEMSATLQNFGRLNWSSVAVVELRE